MNALRRNALAPPPGPGAAPGSGASGARHRAIVTGFTSVSSCSAYWPSSRPNPLILNPPNGAPASNTS